MKTEAEARGCWCPFARPFTIFRNVAVAYNRSTEPAHYDVTASCIASECMAWRWGEQVTEAISDGKGYRPTKTGPSTTEGYCGLAGKP